MAPGAFIKANIGSKPGESWRYAFYLEAALWGLAAIIAFLTCTLSI